MVLGFIFQSNGHNFLNGTGREKICSALWPTLGPRVPTGGQGSLEKEGGAVTCDLLPGSWGSLTLTFYCKTGPGASLGISPWIWAFCISPLHNPDSEPLWEDPAHLSLAYWTEPWVDWAMHLYSSFRRLPPPHLI